MHDEDCNVKKRYLLQGLYANYFEVGHTLCEFIFDFGQFHPEIAGTQAHTRIVTGPIYAKLLLSILQEAVDRYEAEHGVIKSAGLDDE
jgi:hypothetical protein